MKDWIDVVVWAGLALALGAWAYIVALGRTGDAVESLCMVLAAWTTLTILWPAPRAREEDRP